MIANESRTSIPIEYSDFADIFSLELASKLSEHIGINDNVIKLINNQQLPYKPIYSLEQVELDTLKTYIKTNLANGFIRSFKSPVEAPIFFDKKPDENFRLYVDYQRFNNLIIKNRYPLRLVGESLD